MKSDDLFIKSKAIVQEFIDIYDILDPKIPIVNQMVWPLFKVGIYCSSHRERRKWTELVERVLEITHTGTIETIKYIVEKLWCNGSTPDGVLMKLYEEGVDLLPL